MSLSFSPGDDLVFQLESGFGVMRILAVTGAPESVWHIRVYEDLFPDVESAETALSCPSEMAVRIAHLALTDRALSKTPAAVLNNRPVSAAELEELDEWEKRGKPVYDRSPLLMIGMR